MEKTFGEKLKQARTEKKMKQSELAKHLGVTNTTISNWENNISKPDLDMLAYICGVLNVKVSYFLEAKIPEDEITIHEFDLIKRYRSLDPYGQETVNITLNREISRMNSLKEKDALISDLREQLSTSDSKVRYIQYYQRLASAGTGQIVFENLPTEQIEIPDIPEYKKVSYALRVNGRSMEPMYYDNDVLLVEMTNSIDIGEVGIFMISGESYVKKLGKQELISVNDEYDNIPFTMECRCLGRVVDRYVSEEERRLLELGKSSLENALIKNGHADKRIG